MQIKSQDMTIKSNAVNAAKELVALRTELRNLKQKREQSDAELDAELSEKVELYSSTGGQKTTQLNP